MSGIQNKVIAITGASSGIGEATALHLAEQGAKVVLGARSTERLESLAGRIRDAGGESVYAAIDVRRREDLARLVDLAVETFGRLDVLVSNAGVMPISALDELKVDDWDAMIDVNIKGVLNGIAAALPLFRAQKSGHFVNTASTAALKVVPTMSVYSGTKMAVRAISEGLRQEAGPDLRVTIVTPGMTLTPGSTGTGLPSAATAIGIPASAIAHAIGYAIGQPATVDVGEIVVRPTAQA
ncbi:SDR family oxidoreductase [Glaciihabitans sp. dw_435]|uniref:SDR family oxidoreductase n=1 Tax=Glaciihabitans sp. dw_435 TaxID=2720081 RepID=UPI001BD54DCA|nr:SDR family oxidoreductase [Glaciihabitans sp. dw_435]